MNILLRPGKTGTFNCSISSLLTKHTLIPQSIKSNVPVVEEQAAVNKEKIFFPNLDGLRFFSFLIVYCSHIFSTKYDYIKNEPWYRFFKGRLFSDGDLGVSFFFVLSGFLITYLLLKEKEFTGKIHLGSFYIRRALRIWPLYYFCVFFGFVIFPILKSYFGQTPNETADPILCSIFLNNYSRVIDGPPDSAVLSVLWSVAIEEQFYLIWPILFMVVPQKYYQYIFIGVITVSTIFRATHINDETRTLAVISDMAIGGLGAYLSINSKKFLGWIQNIPGWLNLLPWIMTLVFIVFKYQLFTGDFLIIIKRLIIGFFFIWIILEQNFSKYSLFKISQLKTISRLGKYTYGLYCLHTIAVLILMIIMDKLGINKSSWQLWLIEFPLGLGFSIFMAYISYTFFESKFLKLKDRFAFIVKT
jgi:peptidoglycan/LPS O-acetylase OafA/YrhL